MFKKILIANRGEIACRIIKTARRMGIASVAVYSEADRRALHVSLADEAFPIGPAPAADSYLSIENIIEACKKSGTEAVHPGYGFLSERADFCRALMAEGMTFIGPSAAAIEAMGDKIAAKACAHNAGVAIVPGSGGAIANARDAVEIAEAIGYPIMIKASAGGGGKGMRIAASRQEVEDGFARAASEAKAAFGDDRVFIEKFIESPRHIEMQILGDRHGHVVHLGERECSIQRRHQKVIEEAPSPFVDAVMREAMGRQAVALARAVGYDSAGTVEFIVGADKRFYFLEMNTRLQVEHAVSECVTGLDLVEHMIRIAAGEPLALSQDDVTIKGHAIESRVYAENPQRDFLPSTGRLTRFQPPPEKADETGALRLDSGVIEGSEVTVHYDPMLAKLITHAPDRAAAIAMQADALDRFVIDGVAHNLSFLGAMMDHPRWLAGDLSTHFIADVFPHGFAPHLPQGEMARALACVAASIDHVTEMRAWAISGQLDAHEVRSRALSVFLGNQRFDLTLEKAEGGDLIARLEEDNWSWRCRSGWVPGLALWEGTVEGQSLVVQVRVAANGMRLSSRGIEAEARVMTRRAAELFACLPRKRAEDAPKILLCPMPGLLKLVHVAPGQRVAAGEALCMIEAMKMEHVLRAETGGIVKAILVSAGDLIGVDMPILEFE
ncbi:acetyl-CoA carboxylase biotin carboxylase subunit [Methyloferula stellata]|uniref:acetyl-CoA carboxylase biotin carboxylase subunit n=1 Tax=Methyloferula stellata TaxID=876270 RepID=UPI0003A51FCA|nr:acetyl/propionyl/methylcrotonyl-CoA carboxylase subunit alpha [Methyloferula stellata]